MSAVLMVMDTVEKHLATYINWVLTKMYFEYIYTEVCSLGLSWREVNMGSDNGSEPNRRQVIIFTNGD